MMIFINEIETWDMKTKSWTFYSNILPLEENIENY